MEVGWGAPLGDQSDGLDILGIRATDQAVEASLAVGITTISQRGRYLTILPWALGEYFLADAEAGVGVHDPERLKQYLFRVQFLVLACTAVDPAAGEGGGALGSVTYATAMNALRAGETIPFPEDGRGSMLGTYFGPCAALGLVRSGDASRPAVISPRGRAVWEARNSVLDRAEVASLLNDAKGVSPDIALRFAPQFSLKGLSATSAEAGLLREALLTPWSPADPVQDGKVRAAYDRFNATVTWLRGEAEEGLGAEDLLNRQWRRAAAASSAGEPVPLAWAEFEWRRRVHFALELMLSAVTLVLTAKRVARIPEVVGAWLDEPQPSDFLKDVWPEAELAVTRSGRQAVASVPPDLGFAGLSGNWSRLGGGRERATAGFALLAAAARQSEALRSDGRFARRGRAAAALDIVDGAGEEPFQDTLGRLAGVAVKAHLDTTFRKMGSGQKCSLRFYPEGSRLRSTGETAGAGRSGPRLGNVIRILQDAGVEGLAVGS